MGETFRNGGNRYVEFYVINPAYRSLASKRPLNRKGILLFEFIVLLGCQEETRMAKSESSYIKKSVASIRRMSASGIRQWRMFPSSFSVKRWKNESFMVNLLLLYAGTTSDTLLYTSIALHVHL